MGGFASGAVMRRRSLLPEQRRDGVSVGSERREGALSVSSTALNEPVFTASCFPLAFPGGSVLVRAERHDHECVKHQMGSWWVVRIVPDYPPEWGEGETLQEAIHDLKTTCKQNLADLAAEEDRLSGHMRRWLDGLRTLFPEGGAA